MPHKSSTSDIFTTIDIPCFGTSSINEHNYIKGSQTFTMVEELNTPVVENPSSKAFPAVSPVIDCTDDLTQITGQTLVHVGEKSRLLCDWNTNVLEPLADQEESIPIIVNLQSVDERQTEADQVVENSPKDFQDNTCNETQINSLFYDNNSNVSMETVQQVPGTASEFSPDFGHDIVFDYDLASATIQALTTGDVSPLVKGELKCAILAKRLRSGQEEPEIEFKEEQPEEITPEIEEKRSDRRERNKLAARRCRTKKKERGECLQEEIDCLQSKNTGLTHDIKKLQEEHEHLLLMFNTHLGTSLCHL